MLRSWILFTILVLGVAFKLWNPDKEPWATFPFSNESIRRDAYIYYIFEGVNWILAAIAFLIPGKKYFFTLTLFLVLQCLDLVHFLLFFRDEVNSKLYWNIVKVIVFGVSMLYDWLMRLHDQTS